MSSYVCCARPAASHGYPYLVFDGQGELHLPLIVFAKEALPRLAPSSLQKYLTNILPFFSWLDTDPWQVRAHHRWTDPPEVIRSVVREYLVRRLQCRVKPHQEGGEWLVLIALHIFTANGMRIGEIQQLRASSECIVPMVLPPSPEASDQSPQVHWAVQAVPKGHRSSATYYLDDEHLRLLSLIKFMLCEHYGIDLKSGGDLPSLPCVGKMRIAFRLIAICFNMAAKGCMRKICVHACGFSDMV